jgi:hypothetical protein
MSAEFRLSDDGITVIISGTRKVITGPYTAEQIAGLPRLIAQARLAISACGLPDAATACRTAIAILTDALAPYAECPNSLDLLAGNSKMVDHPVAENQPEEE